MAVEAGIKPGGPFTGEAEDAAALLMLAMQAAGSSDGAAIQKKMLSVANTPSTKVMPGEIAKGRIILKDGGDIDYVGASNVEFNSIGEVLRSFKELEINTASSRPSEFDKTLTGKNSRAFRGRNGFLCGRRPVFTPRVFPKPGSGRVGLYCAAIPGIELGIGVFGKIGIKLVRKRLFLFLEIRISGQVLPLVGIPGCVIEFVLDLIGLAAVEAFDIGPAVGPVSPGFFLFNENFIAPVSALPF